MKSKATPTMKANVLIAISVGIWWAANSITAISSKNFMRGQSKPDKNSWSDASKDFRWLELTFLQHLIGAIVSVMWIKLISRSSIWPADASKRTILIASIGNVAGNVATNAAYAMVSSSMTQVVKACEPLFMFGLSLVLYRDYTVLNSTTLLAIVIMVVGASLFVAFDSTFLVVGLLAALCSNVAFPIRNIYLKRLGKVWDSAFQKYAVLSLNSVFVLTPFIISKMAFFQSVALLKNLHQGVISSSFHCTYNLASIYVLQHFTPLTHAILNLLKRGIVIAANLAYFQLPISWKMIIGLGAVLIGLYIYLYRNLSGDKFSPPPLLLVLVAVGLGSIFFIQGPVSTGSTITTTNLASVVSENNISPLAESPLAVANLIRSAWVYDRPFSQEILSNLNSLTKRNPVLVYCGTSHCMKSIADLSNKKISAEFLLIGELVQETPLEEWLSKHLFYKLFAKASFEEHLQVVVGLGILWKYGGVYIEPNVQLQDKQNIPIPSCTKPWIGLNRARAKTTVEHFKLACFPKQYTYINQLATMLNNEYYKPSENYDSVTSISFDAPTVNKYFEAEDLVIATTVFMYRFLSLEPDEPWNQHYGTLFFDARVNSVKTANVGDEIQDFPGLQFLPFMDTFLDRDNIIATTKKDQAVTVFFNAWWGDGRASWPPPPNVHPLLVSIHIHLRMAAQWRKNVAYTMERAPIGCRDTGTLKMLTDLHVPAYFSGCMTLMLQVKSKKKTNEIFIVDVKEEYFQMLPKKIRDRGIRVKHNLEGKARTISQGRFTVAFDIIERYSRAKLIITQRIHSALPCVGMGTPVIFINSDKMPGGGGSKKGSSSRTVGLTTMFHTLDMYKTTIDEVPKWFAKFPWDDPPPNPDVATMMRLRATFWYEIRQRPSLFDAARKFGLIPLSPPTPCKDCLQFHFHFPSPDFKFTWQDHRSIESVFHYHPCANVLVHSNTLDNGRFDVFRETGYQITVTKYNRDELFSRIFSLEPHQIDFLDDDLDKFITRALVLYNWGGFYMDSNVIITQSLEKLAKNFLAWSDESKSKIDLSFMRFEKENKHLKMLVSQYALDKSVRNPNIFSKLIDGSKNSIVEVLGSDKYNSELTVKKCYELNDDTEVFKKKVHTSLVAVSLPSDYSVTKATGTSSTRLKYGTICQFLLGDYCVFCSKLLHV
ncbi:uncharacterized protein LOC135335898 isoform X2 [Halichondria panicea]